MEPGSASLPLPPAPAGAAIARGGWLEVVVTSVEDAREAAAGGANRLEVAAQMEADGLTPPLALVGQIRDAVATPLRVMLRDNASFAPRHEREIERMASVAEGLARIGVEGLVLGFLQDGRVDVGLLCRLLAAAPYLAATFHRAFDAVAHPAAALAALKSCEQVDQVLTAGGAGSGEAAGPPVPLAAAAAGAGAAADRQPAPGRFPAAADWAERLENWRRWRVLARPEMTLTAAGGLDPAAIRSIRQATEVRQFHVGRAARAAPDWAAPVRAERVRALAEAARD